jgi:hypothetical protein
MATISLDRFLWIDVVVAECQFICNVHPHNFKLLDPLSMRRIRRHSLALLC